VYAWKVDKAAWEQETIAFTQGPVTPRSMVNGTLFVLAAKGQPAKPDSEKAALAPGRYLVKAHVEVTDVEALDLPTIEPRGAVMAELRVGDIELRVVGMHLDLSGLRRRQQVLKILDHIEQRHRAMPTVIMGDTNEWRLNGPVLREFDERFAIGEGGPSFHSRKPVAALDRIIVDRQFRIAEAGVNMSDAARTASDHLPIWARLAL